MSDLEEGGGAPALARKHGVSGPGSQIKWNPHFSSARLVDDTTA